MCGGRRRWQFLLPSLRQRELARRRGDTVPDDDSSGDDDSPDEGDPPVRLRMYPRVSRTCREPDLYVHPQ